MRAAASGNFCTCTTAQDPRPHSIPVSCHGIRMAQVPSPILHRLLASQVCPKRQIPGPGASSCAGQGAACLLSGVRQAYQVIHSLSGPGPTRREPLLPRLPLRGTLDLVRTKPAREQCQNSCKLVSLASPLPSYKAVSGMPFPGCCASDVT